MKKFAITILLFSLLGQLQVYAQNTSSPVNGVPSNDQKIENDDDILSINTVAVNVPVGVKNEKGQYLHDLKQEDFTVFENGVKQNITYFEPPGQKPLLIIMMLDTSNSTAPFFPALKQASLSFVENLEPGDKVLPIFFGRDIFMPFSEGTNDAEALRGEIEKQEIKGGGTRLYDAVEFAGIYARKFKDTRKIVILFTDGKDNSSTKATYTSSIQNMIVIDPFIYVVGYDKLLNLIYRSTNNPTFGAKNSGTFRSPDSASKWKVNMEFEGRRTALNYLTSLTQNTVGNLYKAEDAGGLRMAFKSVLGEMRQKYLIGYEPEDTANFGTRKIDVSVNRPNTKIQTRKEFKYDPTRSTDIKMSKRN